MKRTTRETASGRDDREEDGRVQAARAFGVRLRERRRAAGLTQEGLAEACGLSAKFVAHLERAERQPSLHTLLRIGRGLGVPAADLVAEVERDLSE